MFRFSPLHGYDRNSVVCKHQFHFDTLIFQYNCVLTLFSFEMPGCKFESKCLQLLIKTAILTHLTTMQFVSFIQIRNAFFDFAITIVQESYVRHRQIFKISFL